MFFGLHKTFQKLQFALAQIDIPDARLFSPAICGLAVGTDSKGSLSRVDLLLADRDITNYLRLEF